MRRTYGVGGGVDFHFAFANDSNVCAASFSRWAGGRLLLQAPERECRGTQQRERRIRARTRARIIQRRLRDVGHGPRSSKVARWIQEMKKPAGDSNTAKNTSAS